MDLKRTLVVLDENSLLLLADNALPAVTTLVAGGPVHGSWWGHPKGRAIFGLASALEDHPDVAVARLVSGKVTFVHRRLWPALLAVGSGREPWQLRSLPKAALALLSRVDTAGRLRASGEAARVLEERLLVKSEQVHTESGAHAKELESWRSWAKGKGLAMRGKGAAAGRSELEEALRELNARFAAKATLPWAESPGRKG